MSSLLKSSFTGFIFFGLYVESLSLATFCMRTELSPSAVIAAWADPKNDPNLLHDRYPYPPHLSLVTVVTLPMCHPTNALMTQHRTTTCWCFAGSTLSLPWTCD